MKNNDKNKKPGKQTGKNSRVVLYDGMCYLCSNTLKFIIRRDPGANFLFASLQSDKGKKMLNERNVDPENVESVVLIKNDKVYTKSTAVLKIARHLRGLWPLTYAFIIIPRFIRDGVYNYISRKRFKWFGRRPQHYMPSQKEEQRILGLDAK